MIQVGATYHCKDAVEKVIKETEIPYTVVQDGGDDGFTIFKVELPLGPESQTFIDAGAVFCNEVE